MTGHINSSAKHENCNFLLQLVYIAEHFGMLKLPERLCNFFLSSSLVARLLLLGHYYGSRLLHPILITAFLQFAT